LQGCRVAGLQGCRVAGLQGCRVAVITLIFEQKKKILGISDLYFCFEIRNTETKLSLKNQKSFKKPTSSIHDLIISTFIFLSLKRDCRKDKKKLAADF
jgi:predicted MPP superfamily phosphohydrolase